VVALDSNLIPQEVQSEVIQAVTNQSVALQLGQVQPMPAGSEAVPVLGSFPTAGWTTVGGRKPTTTMNWTAQILKAEEVAATIDVPTAYIDDAGFPLWANIQPRMVEALSLAIDEAILFGTAAPASFPVGGVFANSAVVALPPAPENDIAGLFNAALGTVEAQGLNPTGHGADVVVRSLLRGARTTTGEPLFVPSIVGTMPDTVYGLPIYFSNGGAFDTTKAIDFTGDWSCLRIGVRQDVTVDQSAEAVLADSTGKVLVSAFQDDKIIMRVHMRLGCVIGKPVTQKAPTGAKPWAAIPPGLVTQTFSVPEPEGNGDDGNGEQVASTDDAGNGGATRSTKAKADA
jgi:HK97 family phage major capsid protein